MEKYSWCTQFRKAFSMIGNLRSLVPYNVNIIATATTETYHCALKHLTMKDPVLPPDRRNIGGGKF